MKDTAHLKGFGRLATLLIAQKVRPSQAYWFARFVEKLVKSRGPKGALLYLDSLGIAVAESLLGTVQGPRPTWVRRSIIRMFERTSNKSLLRRLTKIKRHIQVSAPTPEQVSKFLNAVDRSAPDWMAIHTAEAHVMRGMETLQAVFPKTRRRTPSSCLVAYVKRELSKGILPDEAYKKALSRLHRDIWTLDQLGYLDDPDVLSLFIESMTPLSRLEVQRLRAIKPIGMKEAPTHVGTLHATQEPGMKLRVFASPLLAIQCMLDPLKWDLMDGLQRLDNDACFSQEEAIATVTSWLSCGQTLYCYDLINATDMEPRSLSRACIRALRHSLAIQKLLIWVEEGNWSVCNELAESFARSTVSWSVGQPLGTGPSFGAFSLAHHALVRGICLHLGVGFDCYIILGDDIVIRNKAVAVMYKRVQDSLGVGISEAKSIISDRVAEFAGFTVTREGHFRPGKWREVTSESLMSFITDPGYDYKRVVPKFWCPLIERMKEQPYPYGLARPELSSLTHSQTIAYAAHVCYAFMRTLTRYEPDGSLGKRFALYSDKVLLPEFIEASGLIDLIYCPKEDDSPLNQRLLRIERKSAEMRAKHAGQGMFTMQFAPTGSFTSHIWRWFHVEDHSEEICSPLSIPGLPSQTRCPSADQLRSTLDYLSVHLSADEKDDVEAFCSLIYSIMRSLSSPHLEHYSLSQRQMIRMWIDQVPFISGIYKFATNEPNVFELIGDLIKAFPYYGIDDFVSSPSRFITLLRRYANQREVIPSVNVPMPRRKSGVR